MTTSHRPIEVIEQALIRAQREADARKLSDPSYKMAVILVGSLNKELREALAAKSEQD